MDEDDYIIIVKDNYNVPVIQKGISNILTKQSSSRLDRLCKKLVSIGSSMTESRLANMYNILSGTYGIISSTYRYVSNILIMYLLICLYINPATYMVISIMGHGPFLVAYIVLFKFLGML